MFDERHPRHPARTLSAAPLLALFHGRDERAIAHQLGVDQGTIRAWRRGGRVMPDTAARIALRLGTTVSAMWYPEEEAP